MPKAVKRPEGSRRKNKAVLRRQKRKCIVLAGTHMEHCKLTAWLPTFPCAVLAAPLTLVLGIAISGQAEARDIRW